MRIGINLLSLGPTFGGSYQYAITFVRHLLDEDLANDYVVFYDDNAVAREISPRSNLALVWSERPKTDRKWYLVSLLRLGCLAGLPLNGRTARGRYNLLSSSQLDLLIQPGHGVGAYLSGVPYLVSIHDGPHVWNTDMRGRVGRLGVLTADLHARALTSKARAVFVDSEVGKNGLVRAYGVPPERIYVLPFKPPDYFSEVIDEEALNRVKVKYELPDSYLFYPSAFYSPKNHAGLVTALDLVRRRHDVTMPLILVGNPGPTLETTMSLSERLGLRDSVRYLGFVGDEDMHPLYRLATALVMPTFAGPTNIPVAEAFSVGCPVICSTVDGYEAQVGDAGLLVDPKSTEELADAIFRVCSDESLRRTLIQRGLQRMSQLSSVDYGAQIARVVQDELGSMAKQVPLSRPLPSHATVPGVEEQLRLRVIDLGCGANKQHLAAIGVDIIPSLATDVVCNLEQFPWPFRDNTFELIFCSHLIEHIGDIPRFMKEVHRVARPGAIFKGFTPHFTNPYSYVDPTHKHHLSLRSFDMFSESPNRKIGVCRRLLNRALDIHHDPDYLRQQPKFEKVRVSLVMGKLYRLLAISWLVNAFPEFYELQGIIRAPCNIYFELKVKK